MSGGEQSSGAWPFVKGGLIVLGGLAAVGFAISLIKPALFLCAVGGVTYLGYRVMNKKPSALQEGSRKKQKVLPDPKAAEEELARLKSKRHDS